MVDRSMKQPCDPNHGDIRECRGGFKVWDADTRGRSGPWLTRGAAEEAGAGRYDVAHRLEREFRDKVGQ